MAAAAGAQDFADCFVDDVTVVRMNRVEISAVLGFGAHGQSEHFVATVGPANHAHRGVIVEGADVGRLQSETDSLFGNAEAVLMLAEAFLFLHYFAEFVAINS